MILLCPLQILLVLIDVSIRFLQNNWGDAGQTGKEPKAIKAIHKLVQPDGFNPCKKNDCEHMCIVTSTNTEKDIGTKPALGKTIFYA